MKKGFLALLIAFAFISCNTSNEEKGRILMIVSNTEDMGDPEKHFAGNNLWEVAPPYHIFVSHGYEVDFVSPTGGDVPFSMDPMGISSYAIKYEDFNGNVENSLTPDRVDYQDYEAVFIGGGYGPLFDVANNGSLLSIIAEIYENGGVVGGCGHGPGAFANVKLSNGEYMVKDRIVSTMFLPSAAIVAKEMINEIEKN